MPTSAQPEGVHDVAETLLACALDGIENAPDGAGPVARSCVVWGGTAWDCDCGQLSVAVGRQYPSHTFPQEGGAGGPVTKCGPPIWVVTYTIEILRCVPGQGDDDKPPPCEAVNEAARLAAIDAWAVKNGVICCLNSMQKDLTDNGATAITNFMVRDQLAVGPQGYCGGSALTVLVGLRNCWCVEGS
jgi:hypothetical protein